MHHGSFQEPLLAAGICLDLRRLRLPANLTRLHTESIEGAFQQMAAIEAGSVINVDEGWQTGHYWLRDPELAPSDYQPEIVGTRERIREFSLSTFAPRFRQILWIGIGGSGLGPQMLYDALRIPGKTPRMTFFDNTDPRGMARAMQEIEAAGGLRESLVVVVSKSGGTRETRNGMLVAQQAFESVGLPFAQHAVAITKPGSELDRAATAQHWLGRFPMWDWVGGRTSITSAVGVLPAELLGFDVESFLQGAREMDRATRIRQPLRNPAMAMALAWLHQTQSRNQYNMVVLPYCDALGLFGKYLQQLIMESIGKDEHGLSVFGNKGSTDQHSFVQQLRDGRRDFFAALIKVEDLGADWEVEDGITVNDYLAAFLEGTEQALADAGRPSLRITLPRFDAYALGALIALFERSVGYFAALIGINAYHQPGVEAGKKAADSLIALQRRLVARLKATPGRAHSAQELAKAESATPCQVRDILRRLSQKKGRNISCDSVGNFRYAAEA